MTYAKHWSPTKTHSLPPSSPWLDCAQTISRTLKLDTMWWSSFFFLFVKIRNQFLTTPSQSHPPRIVNGEERERNGSTSGSHWGLDVDAVLNRDTKNIEAKNRCQTSVVYQPASVPFSMKRKFQNATTTKCVRAQLVRVLQHEGFAVVWFVLLF